MKKYIVMLSVLVLALACEKNQDFQQIVEAPATLVYVAEAGIDNAQETKVVVLPDDYIASEKMFQANVNSSLHGAVSATLTFDSQAIADYNAKYGTSYKPLPESNFSLTAYVKPEPVPAPDPEEGDGEAGEPVEEVEEPFVPSSSATVNVPENERLSTEFFRLRVGGDISALTEENYLLAFALTCPDMNVSVKKNVYYLLVNFTDKLVIQVTSTGDMVGTQIAADIRRSFTADVNGYASLFDGSNSSAVSFSKGTGNVVTVDMLTDYKFSAISLRGANYIYPYIMKLEVSTDGENFSDLGEVGEDNYYMNSYQCYASLVTGISARYVRVTFDFNSPYGSYGSQYRDRLAEIYIYVN